MFAIRAQAPTRIDIAGGTLDLWPLHHLVEHKCTVNVGIDLMATADISASQDKDYHLQSTDQDTFVSGSFAELCATAQLPLVGLLLKALWDEKLPPLVIKTNAGSPKGAGLGGSSTLGIAIAGGLNYLRHKLVGHASLADYELVRLVSNIEARLLNIPTGTQDHWAAVRGGLNIMRYPFLGETVQTLDSALLNELGQSLVLCYSGQSRNSGGNNWTFFKRIIEGDTEARNCLNEIGKYAEICADEAERGNLSGLLKNSQEEWQLRKRLWPTTETEETRRLEKVAFAAGAYFSRICGAGGGGAMVFFSSPDLCQKVAGALTAAGGKVLPVQLIKEGLKVCEIESSLHSQGLSPLPYFSL